jgi:hypothetical protein
MFGHNTQEKGMADITMARATPSAGERRSRRAWLYAVPGVLFVVTLVVGVIMPNTPSGDASDKTWQNYFADRGNQVELLISGFLIAIAGMALLTLLTTLWRRVNAAEPAATRNPLALVAAAAAGALVAAGGTINTVIPGAIIFQSIRVPNADVLRLVDNLGYPIGMVGGMFATALAIVVLTLHARRIGYFGRALSIFSYLAAAAAIAAFLFFPIAIVLIWALVVSVVMARRPGRPMDTMVSTSG